MIDYAELETSERPELPPLPYLPTRDPALIKRIVDEYFAKHRDETDET